MTLSQSYNTDLIVRTPENEELYNKDYKHLWLNTHLRPNNKREDKQLSFLIETLDKEIDITKIQTVLEVGVGFGRIAKGILDAFPIIDWYDGIDISEQAIRLSRVYLQNYIEVEESHAGYCYMIGDFEEYKIHELYDLVISVETMSCLPTNYNVHKWINKMVSLSKKYVVNLDYTEDGGFVFDNPHDYVHLYRSNKDVRALGNVDSDDQSIFIAYIR